MGDWCTSSGFRLFSIHAPSCFHLLVQKQKDITCCYIQVQNVYQSRWNNLRKVDLFTWSHDFRFQCPSVYRQTTDCTEGGGLTRKHCKEKKLISQNFNYNVTVMTKVWTITTNYNNSNYYNSSLVVTFLLWITDLISGHPVSMSFIFTQRSHKAPLECVVSFLICS